MSDLTPDQHATDGDAMIARVAAMTPDQLRHSEHPAVREYVAALDAGSAIVASAIAAQVAKRYGQGDLCGEAAEIYRASLIIPLGG